MKKVLRKSNLVAGVLILVVVCLGIVLAGDVIVKEGTLEAGHCPNRSWRFEWPLHFS